MKNFGEFEVVVWDHVEKKRVTTRVRVLVDPLGVAMKLAEKAYNSRERHSQEVSGELVVELVRP